MANRRDENALTPTEARIMAVLADGQWHSRLELVRAIDPDPAVSNRVILKAHVFNIRKKLRASNQLITCDLNTMIGIAYKLHRQLSPIIDG